MRILRLDLIAFGPFTDTTLLLEGGNYGLHIVYGANEAGKSSSLRALRQFLYGMPERTHDAFEHSNPKLRIGGLLVNPDGDRLECIRRKARKNSLYGGDDKEPIPSKRLAKMLGGVDQETFQKRFGIDYQELVRGGQDIVQGGGELGKILFAAASGVANLGAVQKRLEEEADSLFKPRAQVPAINKGLQTHQQIKKHIKEAQLSTAEYNKLQKSLAECERQKEEVHRKRSEAETQQQRWERFQEALPVIVRRRRLKQQFAAVADAPRLAEGFSEIRRQVQRQFDDAQRVAKEAQEAIENDRGELAQLAAPDDLLSRSEEIQQLYDDRGGHLKAAADRPQLESDRRLLEKQTQRLLQDAGYEGLDWDAAEKLRLNETQRLHIQDLARQADSIQQVHTKAGKTVADLQIKLTRATSEVQEQTEFPDPAPLRTAIRRAVKQGDLGEQLEKIRGAIERTRRQAGIDLKKLGLWSGGLIELEQLAIPTAETIERFENQCANIQNQRLALQRRLEENTDEENDLAEKIDRLQQDIPTEDDLTSARSDRDEGWQIIQQVWRGDIAASDAQIQRWTDNVIADESPREHGSEPSKKLASAFGESIKRTDELADRLRRDADQVAEKAHRMAQRKKLRRRGEELSRELAQLVEKSTQLQQQWEELWRPLEVTPLPPKEMRAWTQRHAKLAALAQTIREHEDEAQALQQRMHSHCRELTRALSQAALSGDGAVDADTAHDTQDVIIEFSRRLDRGEKTLERIEDMQRRRTELQREISRLSEQQRTAVRDAEEAKYALDDWQTSWRKAMSWLQLPGDCKPQSAVTVMDKLAQTFEKQREAAGLTERIEGIDRDACRFAEQVGKLVSEAADDLCGVAPERAVAQLNERLENARQARERRRDLQSRIEKEQKKLDVAQETIRREASQLDALCREAGCRTHDELPGIEERSRTRRQVEHELDTCSDELQRLAAGTSVEEFIGQAEAMNADELPSRIRTVREQVAQFRQENDEIGEKIGGLRNMLKQMDGQSKAAQAEEEAQYLLAQIRDDAEQYARLRLSCVVLKNAIERYRRRNQAEVLHRASELFAELTLGSFSGLKTQPDEKNEQMLVGVRGDGRNTVTVEGMSDGACDQLYLALRLASLEEHLQHSPPLPFIIDDILIMFDDDRAAAALQALARLSRKTQVIFFTHHEHLLKIAQRCAPKQDLFIHRLGEPTRSAAKKGKTPRQRKLAFGS